MPNQIKKIPRIDILNDGYVLYNNLWSGKGVRFELILGGTHYFESAIMMNFAYLK